MKPLEQCKLYTFVDTAYLHGRTPVVVAQQLCDGGTDIIQLRAKGAPIDAVRRMADAILPIVRKANVGLVINDHPRIARETGADFCHLGQEDFFGAGYKHISELEPATAGLRIGLSTHAPEQAMRAVAAGAHYIAIGPVFPTATKPTAKPTTLEYVRWAAANIAVPWFAIGGITLVNLDALLEAGARRICVVSAILNADDITRACAEFRRQLDRLVAR